MNRFASWRRGAYQGANRRPNSFSRNFNRGQQNRGNLPSEKQAPSQQTPDGQSGTPQGSPQQAAALEEGLALQSEVESGPEDLDDTVYQFAAAMEEKHRQEYEDFCAYKDMLRGESLPGNY